MGTATRNLVPGRERAVAVASVDVPLTEAALRERFLGREAYRRTAFIVCRRGGEAAVLRVTKASEDALMSPIVDAALLAGPEETAVVRDPLVDTGVPTQLARAAGRDAPGARCVVVQGRYEHVSFILDPDPVPVRVVEVVPPHPAKLLDQARRVLELAEDLPPVDLRPETVDLLELARGRPAPRYLFPCRGAGVAPAGAEVRYLDERPPREDWVLVGCERSRELHRWFYGDEPPSVEMCPRELLASGSVPASELPTLTKCCLRELGVGEERGAVVVPWGATLEEVHEGLRALVRTVQPTWSPA
ncbi:MAG TPA: hypothetical protein VNO79_02450 [Actinomycetota bacterium]|nr:hypothetical protein [Actinomycetota bacterium]